MNYETYMEDYLVDFEAEMFSEAVEYKITYYFRDNLMPLIDKAMTAKGIDAVIDFTGSFIDSHSKELFTSGPVYNFTFDDKETSFFYKLFGLDREKLVAMFKEVVSQTYTGEYVKNLSRIHNVQILPHSILITGLIIWALQNKNEDILECGRALVSFITYPIMYRTYWKHGVREDIMDYTIEHLSSKSIIKKQKNLLAYLIYHGDVCIKNFEARLKTGADHVYVDFHNRVRTQLNSSFRKIANGYMENFKNNASMHTTKGKMDDGNISNNESLNSNVGNIAENTYSKFKVNGTNESVASNIADGCNVSKDKLVAYLNRVFSANENQLFKLIEDILILFFKSDPVDEKVGSGVFLNFGLALYRSIGTSKETLKQDVNRIMNLWVYDILEINKDYPTREASVISYRRAIFNYVIFMIQRYN